MKTMLVIIGFALAMHTPQARAFEVSKSKPWNDWDGSKSYSSIPWRIDVSNVAANEDILQFSAHGQMAAATGAAIKMQIGRQSAIGQVYPEAGGSPRQEVFSIAQITFIYFAKKSTITRKGGTVKVVGFPMPLADAEPLYIVFEFALNCDRIVHEYAYLPKLKAVMEMHLDADGNSRGRSGASLAKNDWTKAAQTVCRARAIVINENGQDKPTRWTAFAFDPLDSKGYIRDDPQAQNSPAPTDSSKSASSTGSADQPSSSSTSETPAQIFSPPSNAAMTPNDQISNTLGKSLINNPLAASAAGSAPQATLKSPKELCADRPNFISRSICESRACKTPDYQNHPACVSANPK